MRGPRLLDLLPVDCVHVGVAGRIELLLDDLGKVALYH